jgi:hypothetical protein
MRVYGMRLDHHRYVLNDNGVHDHDFARIARKRARLEGRRAIEEETGPGCQDCGFPCVGDSRCGCCWGCGSPFPSCYCARMDECWDDGCARCLREDDAIARIPQLPYFPWRTRWCDKHGRHEPVPAQTLLTACVHCGAQYLDEEDARVLDALPCVDPVSPLCVSLAKMIIAKAEGRTLARKGS